MTTEDLREIGRKIGNAANPETEAIKLLSGFLAASQPSREQTQARCPRCKETKLRFVDGSDLVGWMGKMLCESGKCQGELSWFDIEDWTDFAQFFRPSHPSGSAGAQEIQANECKWCHVRIVKLVTGWIDSTGSYQCNISGAHSHEPEASTEPAAEAHDCSAVCHNFKPCGDPKFTHWCKLKQGHPGDHQFSCPAEPAVVSASPEPNRCSTCAHPEAVHDRLGCAMIGCNCRQFAAAQPVAADLPKVEDVSRDICEALAKTKSNNSWMEIVRSILRPYFTQVSQPPTETPLCSRADCGLPRNAVIHMPLRANFHEFVAPVSQPFREAAKRIEDVLMNASLDEIRYKLRNLATELKEQSVAPVSGNGTEPPTSPEDVPDLYRLAYMPGVWRCPQCEFVLSKATISMASGSIGTTPEDRQSEECPNDGTFMVPVTYKESLKQCQDRLIQELERTGAASHNGQGWNEENYVAWCRRTRNTIVTCDSDAPGAFKVYRWPLPAPPSEADGPTEEK